MDTQEAIAEVDNLLSAIPNLRAGSRFSTEHVRWMQNCAFVLSSIFGPQSGVRTNFAQLTWSFSGSRPIPTTDNPIEAVNVIQHDAYLSDLDSAEGFLLSAKDELERVGLDEVRRAQGYVVSPEARKVFISHGTQTPALERVERFMRALGVEPVIVIRGASEGAGLDDLVEQRMRECECAVILATGDDEVEGHKQPRMNVIHEIGLAQEMLKNRVIYLKEEGCEFPSNINPKVWEGFTQTNLEAAQEKIVKELRAFGLLP